MKKRISLVVGVSALLAFAGMAQAASTRFAVQDATSTDKMVVQDNGFIGVGTNAPTSPITIKATTGFPNNMVRIESAVPGAPGGGGIVGYSTRSDGSQPLAGDRLGFIYFGTGNSGVPGAPSHPAGFEALAEGDHTPTSWPAYFTFATTPVGSKARTERMRITSAGFVGIGTTAPKSKLHVTGLPVFANNAAAVAGGLTAGAFYRNGGDPDHLCVVH